MKPGEAKTAVRIHQEISQRLRTIYGLAEDDQALADTVEGESDLVETLGKVLREARETRAMAEGLEVLIGDIQARQRRLDEKFSNLRHLAQWMIDEGGLKGPIRLPDMTISISAGKPGLQIDENALKDEFKREVKKLVVDRDKVQAAVDAGQPPYGVSVTNAKPVMTVRTK